MLTLYSNVIINFQIATFEEICTNYSFTLRYSLIFSIKISDCEIKICFGKSYVFSFSTFSFTNSTCNSDFQLKKTSSKRSPPALTGLPTVHSATPSNVREGKKHPFHWKSSNWATGKRRVNLIFARRQILLRHLCKQCKHRNIEGVRIN